MQAIRNGATLEITQTMPAPARALGYQQLTAITAATAPTVPAGTVYADIVAEAQPARWRDDTTAPTATVGMLLAVDVPYRYSGDFTKIQFIQSTSGTIVNISYYG